MTNSIPGAGRSRVGRRRRTPILIVLLAFAMVSCTRTPSPSAERPVLDVTLKDFWIESSLKSVDAGEVRFVIHNDAPVTHEFVVVRTDRPADELPLGADGLSVEEDGLPIIDEIGEIDTESVSSLDVTLEPGRYVFFCNLEGHYLGGMAEELEVTSDG